MNRLTSYFENKDPLDSTLNMYFTAGYPHLDDTLSIILNLEKAGADIIELGIPFSDPLADGPTIQQSSERALENGMSIDFLFTQLKSLRQQTQIPVVLMGYLNPVIQYGVTAFIEKAAEVGVDGFILPDLPIIEFEKEWKNLLIKHQLTFTFLITPETSIDRIKKLDQLSSGFLYAVSSSSTTGNNNSKTNDLSKSYLSELKNLQLKNPVVAGFGIKNNEMFTKVNDLCDGAIIGSAFIKHITKNGAEFGSIQEFISDIKSSK